MYVVLQLLFALAAVGIFLIYFLIASVLGLPTTVNSPPAVIAAVATLLLLLFFSCGLNAGLLRSYAAALEGRKTTVAEFLRYSLKKAAPMFAVMLMRDLVLAVIVGPVVLLYVSSLSGAAYMDVLVGAYALCATFLIHFLFTPAFVSIGAFGTEFVSSLRIGIGFLRRKHVNALGLYAVFALAWLLNLVPIVQIITILVVYPVVYSAFVVMFQGSGSGRSR
jgi:hypothetical protein